MRERARHPGDPGEAEHGRHQQDDVAARDGQQVCEPGGAERLQRLVVEGGGAAQRDPRRDARRLVVAAGGERGACPAAQPVERPWQTARAARPATSERAASVSCTPCRASQVRRSKSPVEGGTGASEPLTTTIAPCCSAPRARQLDRMTVEPRDRRAPVRARPAAGRRSRARARATGPTSARSGSAARAASPCADQAAPAERADDADDRERRGAAARAVGQDEQREHHQRAAERSRSGQRGQREPGRQPGRRRARRARRCRCGRVTARAAPAAPRAAQGRCR